MTAYKKSGLNVPRFLLGLIIVLPIFLWQSNIVEAAVTHEQTRTGSATGSPTSVTTLTNLTAVTDDLYLAAISTAAYTPVNSVSGLGLSWQLVKAQCGGKFSSGIDVWMAHGTPTGDGPVTASFGTAPTAAVITVSRYSGVDALDPLGNSIGKNNVGINDTQCARGIDSIDYSVSLDTIGNNSLVYGAAAIRRRIHTPGSGFDERIEIKTSSGGGLNAGASVEDKIAVSPGSVAVDGTFDLVTDYAVVAVEVRAGPNQGDANGDGLTDYADYNIWLTNYSLDVTGGAAVGDFNLDSKVNGTDYGIWYSAFSSSPDPSPVPSGITVGMFDPPEDKICDYPMVAIIGDDLFNRFGSPDLSRLDTAQACGTKVILAPIRETSLILQDDGTGLDLVKVSDILDDYKNIIDPYVTTNGTDGTIIASLIVDEPHDCVNDWGGVCPTPAEVDQAGQISKGLWPTLPTLTVTLAEYANDWDWQYIDIISFQYAKYKDTIDNFVNAGVAVLDNDFVSQIAWGIQAISGGGGAFEEHIPMTPAEVLLYGQTMCSTKKGSFVHFTRYDETLLTPEMLGVIDDLKTICGG